MTAKQRIHLMAELWPDAAAALGCSKDDRERRLEELSKALGRPIESANDIDHLKEFDAVKAHMLSISQGTNVAAQMRIANMPKTRLIHKCRSLHPEAYIITLARDRFGTEDWTGLANWQLTQLRNTLSARARGRRREQPATVNEAEKVDDELVPF